MTATIVDTAALWKIIVASLVCGVGVVIAFGLALLGVQRAKDGVQYMALTAVGGLFCTAALAVGVWAMTQKP